MPYTINHYFLFQPVACLLFPGLEGIERASFNMVYPWYLLLGPIGLAFFSMY